MPKKPVRGPGVVQMTRFGRAPKGTHVWCVLVVGVASTNTSIYLARWSATWWCRHVWCVLVVGVASTNTSIYLARWSATWWCRRNHQSLKEFIQNETVPSPIDIANNAIDDHLSKTLTKLCGYDNKLVVGRAEYKRIIEMHLGITCLHVDVPDCEIIICSQEKPMCTLSPRKLIDPVEDLALFLWQHDINFKPETVNETIVMEADSLHQMELRERDHLKFLLLLLKDFITISGINTTDWHLIHFVTALKMVCFPEASYVIYPPYQIFSPVQYERIKAHASGHDIISSKIDVMSVYEDVVRLISDKFFSSFKLDIYATRAIKNWMTAEAIRLEKYNSVAKPSRTYLSTGSGVGKGSTNVDGRLDNELDLSPENDKQDNGVKQTHNILQGNPGMEKPSGFCNKENHLGQQVISTQSTNAGGQLCLSDGCELATLVSTCDGEKICTGDDSSACDHSTTKDTMDNVGEKEREPTCKFQSGQQEKEIPDARNRSLSGTIKEEDTSKIFSEILNIDLRQPEENIDLRQPEEREASSKCWGSFSWPASKHDRPSKIAGQSSPIKAMKQKFKIAGQSIKAMKHKCVGFICCYFR